MFVRIDICPTLLILLSVYIYFDILYISENCIYAAHFLFVTNLYVCDVCISRAYGVGVLNVWKEPLGLLGLCPPSCLCAMQERWHLSPIILSCRQDHDSPLAAASHSG